MEAAGAKAVRSKAAKAAAPVAAAVASEGESGAEEPMRFTGPVVAVRAGPELTAEQVRSGMTALGVPEKTVRCVDADEKAGRWLVALRNVKKVKGLVLEEGAKLEAGDKVYEVELLDDDERKKAIKILKKIHKTG